MFKRKEEKGVNDKVKQRQLKIRRQHLLEPRHDAFRTRDGVLFISSSVCEEGLAELCRINDGVQHLLLSGSGKRLGDPVGFLRCGDCENGIRLLYWLSGSRGVSAPAACG